MVSPYSAVPKVHCEEHNDKHDLPVCDVMGIKIDALERGTNREDIVVCEPSAENVHGYSGDSEEVEKEERGGMSGLGMMMTMVTLIFSNEIDRDRT